jgi:hypothetical protein
VDAAIFAYLGGLRSRIEDLGNRIEKHDINSEKRLAAYSRAGELAAGRVHDVAVTVARVETLCEKATGCPQPDCCKRVPKPNEEARQV